MKRLLYALFFAAVAVSNLRAVDNPVVEIYDGCILRFGGLFYAMGTGTEGSIYSSSDMIHWKGPVPVANADKTKWLDDPTYHEREVYPRIGAGDIVYHNGLFHIYYNGIGHAVSTWPTQPFTETSDKEPFCVYGIDPQLFIEPNGDLIFLRKVQTKDPITLERWTEPKATFMWPLKTPFSYGANPFTGDKQAVKLNSGEKGRNDHVDKNNFEGGELYTYRGEYYLLNSGSCMSARTGLYNAFCTQSSVLSEMGNEDKYPHEVLTRNLEKFHLQYRVLAAMSDFGEWWGRMRTDSVPSDWFESGFDDSSWPDTPMGIGYPKQDRDVDIRHVRTFWQADWKEVFVRREFTVDIIPEKPLLLYRLEGSVEYYLNGKRLFEEEGSYRGWRTKAIAADAFVKGRNVLAIRCSGEGSRKRYMDVGVYDAGKMNVEDPVIGPSQLNLLLGPNGFEHVVVYKAFWNGDSFQGVDRVYFYDRELVVDGPTTPNTTGYHPNPAAPSIQEDFSKKPSESVWEYKPEVWKKRKGNQLESDARLSAILTKTSASHYLIETTFSLPEKKPGSAGVIVWYKDVRNFVEIVVSRAKKKWFISTISDGVKKTKALPLPSKFMFFEPNDFVEEKTPSMHELRVYKNGASVNVWLDHFLLTLEEPIKMGTDEPGQTGIVQHGGQAVFGHMLYTKGWDEYGTSITGWKSRFGNWKKTADGVAPVESTPIPSMLEKGDDLINYNFECNVKNAKLPSSGLVVFCPLWIDESNHVAAVFDYAKEKWIITERVNGTESFSQEVSTQTEMRRVHEFEPPYEKPATEYRYNLKGESKISTIKLLWMEGAYPYIFADFGLPQEVELFYLNDSGRWQPVNNLKADPPAFSIYNELSFDPVKTTALQLRCKADSSNSKSFRPYHIEATIDLPSTFFFRSVRNGKNVKLFYNQTQIATFETQLPASHVAIGSTIKESFFSGIMCYQNGADPR